MKTLLPVPQAVGLGCHIAPPSGLSEAVLDPSFERISNRWNFRLPCFPSFETQRRDESDASGRGEECPATDWTFLTFSISRLLNTKIQVLQCSVKHPCSAAAQPRRELFAPQKKTVRASHKLEQIGSQIPRVRPSL